MDNEASFSNTSTLVLQVFIALFVIFATIVLFTVYKRWRGSKNVVLLTGLCESGKTLIFAQLIYHKYVQTYSSIKPNSAQYLANKTSLQLVDIPGNQRLHSIFFEKYKSNARGIIFVVDSSTVQRDVRDVAEALYNILSDNVIRENNPSVLILCNKQDKSLAKGANAIKTILENEMNTLSVTKSRQLDSVDPKARKNATIVKKGENFEFARMKVQFAECSACGEDESVHIEKFENWIRNVA